jgi:methylmalonyl-CoA mutase
MMINEFFQQQFNTQRDQWEKSLRSELKTEEISGKVLKKSVEGACPTLSLTAPVIHQLKPVEAWKKAAQTYIRIPQNVKSLLEEDLQGGARLFFFEKDFLSEKQWENISETLSSHQDAKDIVVVLLGDKEIPHEKSALRIIDEKKMCLGRGAWAPGGTIVQELSQIALALTDKKIEGEVHLGVFIDGQFFKNIAKVRAARLLAEKILSERKIPAKIFITGLTSYREWTLYERYSNMLRNDVSVASALIAGCDFVQSAGYESLLELETKAATVEHAERSKRMARNTSHILSLESALGVVEDASFGSYHLEGLTEEYAREAWTLMQKLLPMNDKEISDFFMKETTPVREERMKSFATRKHVLAGVNDFPDVKEELHLSELPVARFFRTGRAFEELRLRMENAPKKPEVYLAIFGDYAALNLRVNFVKNYFELLGLKVTDPGRAVTEADVAGRKEDILVLVASDSQYENLKEVTSQAKEKYVAGKVEVKGFTNLFAGQNVLQILTGIIDRWGKK